jgi:Uma2 family endonuclease
MAQTANEIRRMTVAEYDSFVAGLADDNEFELIDGELVMMVNPTESPKQIAANIGAPLKLAMDRRGCRTYQGGMRVQRGDDSSARDKYRPDVLVVCGGQRYTLHPQPLGVESGVSRDAPSRTAIDFLFLCFRSAA